jgi:hypothetical protein
MTRQEELKELWLGGPEGNLCPREQLKAWALKQVWLEDGKSVYGMYSFIAGKVRKNDGDNPEGQSVRDLLDKIDDDDKDWFPGKLYGAKRGRKRVLTGVKATALCQAAKAIKSRGGEVTYAGLCGAAPTAVLNPETGEAVDKQAVYTCIEEGCYDKDPAKRWANRTRLGRRALTSQMVARRYVWAKYMKQLTHTVQWYFSNLVWVDICASILPTTEAKAAEQALARKSNKTWCSEDALSDDENLRGDVRVLTTRSWDTQKVWWLPMLTRGLLHIEMLPADFPGDKPEGAEVFVNKVRAGLNVRFQGSTAPHVLFTDRGAGFFNTGNGLITTEYKNALTGAGLKAFMRDDASVQPGKLSDLMLHETAVAWIRKLERQTVPKKSWEETPDELISRLKRIAAKINKEYKVTNLCRELPARVATLAKKRGRKLNK